MRRSKGICSIVFLLILAVTVCVTLSSCGDKEYNEVSVNNADKITEDLRTAMINRSYALDVSFSAKNMDEDALKKLAEECIAGVFYESEDPKGGDYLRFQYGGCDMIPDVEDKVIGYGYKTRILPRYYTTAEQEAYVDEQVKSIVELYNSRGDGSETDKVVFVRDYICDLVSYDTVHKRMSGSGHVQSTAYGCLFYHTALCQGYSVLCYRLLKELGLDARIVTGDLYLNGESERHAWNIVRIDDRYYNLDVTMDDISESYDHFLKCDDSFNVDHKKDEKYSSGEFPEEYPMAEYDLAADIWED